MRWAHTLLILTMVLLPLASTSVAEDEAPGELLLRIYPVGQLTIGRTSHLRAAEPVVGPETTSDEERPLFGRTLEEPTLPLGVVDELIEGIAVSVDPWFWDEREGAALFSIGERHIGVRATAEVHARVRARLAELEQLVCRTVTIELESWRLPPERAEALLADGAAAVLEGEALDRLRADGVLGPSVSVTAYAGQMAVAWGGRQVSWIGDADVEVAQEASTTDPIVFVSNLGLMVQAMAAVAPDYTVLLGVDAALAELSLQRTLATQRNGALQAPHHEVVRIRPVVRIPSGSWSVLDSAVPFGAGPAWVFLARATVHDVARRESDGGQGTVDLGAPIREAPTLESTVLRTFDVRDLTTPVRSLPWRVPHLWPSSFTPPEPPELPEPHAAVELDQLVELLREGDGGGTWEDPASIEGRSGMLLVRNTPEVLASVERRIAALRRALPWTLVVSAEVVEVPTAVAAAFTDRGPLTDEARHALEAARRGGEVRSIDTLRVTSMRGHHNVVRSGTVVNYLQDYEVEIAQAASIGNPVFLDVFSGSQLAVAAGLAPDGRTAQIDVDFVRTELPLPLARMNTIHGEIEVPELGIFQLRTAVQATFGRTVLVGSWAHEGRRRLLLLTPYRR